jgi:hypothetical protein
MQPRDKNFMPAGRRGLLMQGTAEEMRPRYEMLLKRLDDMLTY